MFADIAMSELRSTDLLGRLGGEEFGAVLFGAEAPSAAATAERIRHAFAATHPGGGRDQGGVSVSIGVATVPMHESTEIETLLTRADEALYVAKARGRNRVEVADGYAEAREGTGRGGREKPAADALNGIRATLPRDLAQSPPVAPFDEPAAAEDGKRRATVAIQPGG
jgi:hypothetical protein